MTSAVERRFSWAETLENPLNEQRCARLNIYITNKEKENGKRKKYFHEQRLEKTITDLPRNRYGRGKKGLRVFETFQLSVPGN